MYITITLTLATDQLTVAMTGRSRPKLKELDVA